MLTLLLTTGIITTLITSLLNVVLTYKTNRNVKDVEKLKRRYQMDFLRFDKINNLRIDVNKYLIFSPHDLIDLKNSQSKKAEIVTKLITESEELTNLYNLHSPFFDSDIRNNLETSKKLYRDHRWSLQELIVDKGEVSDNDKFDKGLPILFELGFQFKKDFEEAIDTQMTRLDITER